MYVRKFGDDIGDVYIACMCIHIQASHSQSDFYLQIKQFNLSLLAWG